MSRRQVVALWIGALVFTGLGLYPPVLTERAYLHSTGRVSSWESFAGHRLIFRYQTVETFGGGDGKLPGFTTYGHVDALRLAVEWTVVAVLTGVAFVTLGRREMSAGETS